MSHTKSTSYFRHLYEILIVASASSVTFALADGSGLHPIIASAAIGLIGSFLPGNQLILSRDLHGAIYIGSFTGMVSSSLVINSHELVLIGVISGLISVVSKRYLIGIGGKMGTISFLACLLYFTAVL